MEPRTTDVAAVRAAMLAWLARHPEATLLEIEEQTDRQLRDLRADLISDVAECADSTERPVCPACGTVMRRDGRRQVRKTTAYNGEVAITGQTWRCPACGAGFFPPR